MNKSLVGVSLIALVSISTATLPAMTSQQLSQAISNTSNQLYKQLGMIENVIPSTVDLMRSMVIAPTDEYIVSRASGDKDLLTPWATIKQSSDVILTYISLWNAMAKQGKIDKVSLNAASDKVTAATANINDAVKKVAKTTFIRSAKKEAATMLKYFGEHMIKIGKATQGALNLKYNQTR